MIKEDLGFAVNIRDGFTFNSIVAQASINHHLSEMPGLANLIKADTTFLFLS